MVDLPLNLAGISHTFITEQYELFIIGNTEEHFMLYKIDLDLYHDKVNKKDRDLKLTLIK